MAEDWMDWSIDNWSPAPLPNPVRTLPSPSQYRDPALQPGFRVKTGDELSGYTRETPAQESARLAGEYNRAGSNNPEAYGYSSAAIPSSIPMVGGFKPFQFLQQSAAGIAQGGIEGIVGTVGGVTDTLTRISDNVAGTDFGSPVNSALMAYERRMQEMGEGNASWFFRNVAKSITKVVAAAPTGGVGIAANLFLEPAHQSYMRGRESGMSPKVALGYGVLHGATEAVANAVVERVLPGTSSMVTGLLSSAVADDVAKVAVPGIVNALMKTGQASLSEGAEEGVAFGIGAAIDETFRLASGVAAGKQYTDAREFAWDFAKSVGMGLAAGGLLAGGLQSVRWDSTAKAIEQLGQQPAQTPPSPTTPEAMNAPQQPTPLADPTLPLQPTGPSQPNPVDPGQGVEPQVTPVQQPVERPQSDTDEPWSMTRDEFFRRIDTQSPVKRGMSGEETIRGIDFIRANGSEATKQSLLRGSEAETEYLASVGNAIATGKDVPQLVLSQFPEFVKRQQPNQFAEPSKLVEPIVAQQPEQLPQPTPAAISQPEPVQQQSPTAPKTPFRDSDRFQRVRAEEIPDPGEGEIIDIVAEIEKARAKKKLTKQMVAGDMFWLDRIRSLVRPAKYNEPGMTEEWSKTFRRSLFAAARAGKIDILFTPGSDGDLAVGNKYATFFKLADKGDAPSAQPESGTLFDREMTSLDTASPQMVETRREVASKPADVIAKIAALEKPSRGAFAQALGVKPGNLPNTLDSQPKREYAIEVAKKVQAYAQQQQSAPEKTGGVFDVMERLMPGAVRNGSLLPVRDVRAQFPNLSKEQFDAGVLRMSREGKISLHKHDAPGQLSPQEREQAITDGNGNFYVGMAVRGASAVNSDREEARVGGRGTVRPRQEGEVVPQVDMRNPRMKSVEELNRRDKKWTGTNEIPRTPPQADTIPKSIPLDAPPVTETYERGAAEVLNPTGAGDAMAQSVPTGKLTDVRMETNPNAEDASVVEISDLLERLTERLTGSKTPRGEGGFRQPSDDQSLEGFHNRKNKSVRMKSWSDMPTAAHELAHSIWNFSDVLTWKKGDTRKNRIEAEFIELGKQMYPDGDRVLQTKEGFSEVVRLMVQEGDAKAAQKAPVFVKWFKDRLREKDPEALAELEKTQGLANTFWRDMGAQQRAESQQRGVKGTIAQAIEAMRLARLSAVDWLWSSGKVFQDIDLKVDETNEKKGLAKTPVGKRLMDAVRVFSGGTSLAKYWFDTNQTDAFMGIVGPSAQTILSPLEPGEQEAKFWTYMYARRTIAVADPASLAAVNVYRQWLGKEPINPRETGLSVADARQIVAEVEAGKDWDTIQKVAKEFDTFNRNTLKYMVQAAPAVFTSQGINIEESDPGAWIPLPRDITLSDFAFRQGNGRRGSGQNIGWKFRGSGMPIKNILASWLTETERRIDKANKQAVIEAMLNLVIDRDGSQPMNGLGEYIQVLDSPTRDTFEFKRDGKTVHVLLNTRVQRAIRMMNQTDRDALNVVMRMVYGGLRTTTQLATMFRLALNPAYVFTSRPLGNLIDAIFKTPATMGAKGYKETAEIGAKSIARFFSISAEAFANAAFDKSVSKDAAEMLDYVSRAGLEFNVGIRGNELEAARIGRALGRGPMRDERDMVGWLDSHIDWLKNLGRKASDVAESSFVADQAVAAAAWLDANPEAKAKLARGESLTMAEISAMKETVTDVTGNAADDPLIGKALSRVGMFLPSVGVRYTKAGVVAFKKNPAVILKLGLPLAALVVLKELWKLHEDEDYRKWVLQNPTQAVRYTLVDVNGKQVMVPNYTELGLTFVGLPRALAITMYTADPAAAGAWATSMVGNLMPTGEVPAISFMWQQATGKDRWGKAIVSEYSDKPKGYSEPSSPRDRIAEEQYTDRTNPVAKAIAQTPGAVFGRENLDNIERYIRKIPVIGSAVGGTMNLMRSPMRVEHAMNFWSGGTAGKLNDISQGRKGVADMVIRTEDTGTLSRPGEMGSEFYATLDRLQKREADKSKPLSKEDEDGLRLLSAANEVMSVQRRLRNKASDRNGEKAVASAMSLVADNAMRDLEAKRYDTSAYKIAKRVNEVAEAKIDNEPAKIAEKVANGVAPLSMSLPLAVERGKNIKEEQDRRREEWNQAQRFIDAVGMTKKEVYDLAKSHWATQKEGAGKTVRLAIKLGIPQEQR